MYTHEHLGKQQTQDMTDYNIPYASEPTINFTEYQLSIILSHELTMSCNDFAGIGDHLGDFDSEDYASADDFVVE